MHPQSSLALAKRLLLFGRHYRRSLKLDHSYAGEYAYLRKIMTRLQIAKGFVVDVAASDGVGSSSTLGFFRDVNWRGLAVEMDPDKFSKLAFVYAGFTNAKLARSRVTPSNVSMLMRGFEVPPDFELLNLDIDSYDLYVIDELLKGSFRPKVISMEINEKIPPPIFFTVNYDDAHYWRGDHFFGCSLTAAASVVKAHGYILESVQYNNAVFVRADVAGTLFDDLSSDSAYDVGYRNKADRTKLFPWNADVDGLLALSTPDAIKSLNELFAKYDGKYTLRTLSAPDTRACSKTGK